MIGSVILWVVAIFVLFIACAGFEVAGEAVGKGDDKATKQRRLFAFIALACAIALIVVAART